jgi:Leucine-rich repeat (LRR) protein
VQSALQIVFNEWLVAFCVPILIGAAFTLLADEFKEYRAARICFWSAAILVWGKALMWSVFTSEVFAIRAVAVFLICGIVGTALMESLRLTTRRERLTSQVAGMPEATPSQMRTKEQPPGEATQTSNVQPAQQTRLGDSDTGNPLGSLAQLGWGVKDAKDVTTFEIANRPLPDMAKSAGYFRALRKQFRLQFQQVPSIVGLRSLAGVSNCTEVSIGASDISDLSDLHYLTSLRKLNISQTPFTIRNTVLDISPLASLVNLNTLTLNMSRVADLTPIRGLRKLQVLNIGSSLVRDLTPIAKLRSVKNLDVRDSGVTDMSALAGYTALEELDVGAKQVPALVSLRELPNLTKLLVIAQVPVDTAPIGTLSHLQNLSVFGLPVIDAAPFRNLSKLQNLALNGIGFGMGRAKVVDVEAIGSLGSLKSLSLSDLDIGSLRFLAGQHSLVELNLHSLPIASIPELATLTSLEKLSLADMPIVDISPLLSLADLREVSLMRTPARADVISELEKKGVKITIN